jgi:hypothetical protein
MQAEYSVEPWKYQLNLQLLVEWPPQSGNSIQLVPVFTEYYSEYYSEGSRID